LSPILKDIFPFKGSTLHGVHIDIFAQLLDKRVTKGIKLARVLVILSLMFLLFVFRNDITVVKLTIKSNTGIICSVSEFKR